MLEEHPSLSQPLPSLSWGRLPHSVEDVITKVGAPVAGISEDVVDLVL